MMVHTSFCIKGTYILGVRSGVIKMTFIWTVYLNSLPIFLLAPLPTPSANIPLQVTSSQL
jgi:hypothetical protein